MPEKASAKKAAKPAVKKTAETSVKKEEPRFECGDCPVARAFGLCGEAGSHLKSLNVNDFLAHMASARREFLLGMKSMLDEAIRLEEERVEKRQAASTKKKGKNEEQLRRISID
jgi:hypothetical protein